MQSRFSILLPSSTPPFAIRGNGRKKRSWTNTNSPINVSIRLNPLLPGYVQTKGTMPRGYFRVSVLTKDGQSFHALVIVSAIRNCLIPWIARSCTNKFLYYPGQTIAERVLCAAASPWPKDAPYCNRSDTSCWADSKCEWKNRCTHRLGSFSLESWCPGNFGRSDNAMLVPPSNGIPL